MTKKIQWTDEQIEYLKENYLYKKFSEMESEIGLSESVMGRMAKALGLPPKTQKERIEHQFGMDICKLLYSLHWEKGMSVNQMEKHLGITRLWINTHMKECGIEWRGQSEAQKKVWSDRAEDERKAQTFAANEKSRDLAKTGNLGFQVWERENPELAHEQRVRSAGMVAASREANGNNWMAGRTGPLAYQWKGGKDEYHRLRSTTIGSWWINRKLALRRDEYTCQQCGANGEGVIIDVHHKIELRVGGTNLLDNLICYCRSCHIIEHGARRRRKV